MTEIDLTHFASSSDAYDAAEAAFVATNPEPTPPEKTFTFSRPLLIETGNGRLWIEARQSDGYGHINDPIFNLCSHELTSAARFTAEEVQALINQLTLKLSEYQSATAYKAAFDAYNAAHREWTSKKNEAGEVARIMWRKAQQTLKPAPEANDYSTDEIEEEGYDEDDFEDEDEDL